MNPICAAACRPAPRRARRGAAALRLGALLLLAILAGCRSLPAPDPDAAAQTFAGRFSLSITHRAAGDPERQEVWSGRFALAVGAQSMRLDLVSPLGATLARFESDAQEARLLVPEGGGVRVEHGPDTQSLSERVLGWSLPMAGMADWIAGHPAPGRPFRALPAPDSPAAPAAGPPAPDRFEQDGWTVVVERADGAPAARRVQMSRPAQADAPAVALRVVLDPPVVAAPHLDAAPRTLAQGGAAP